MVLKVPTSDAAASRQPSSFDTSPSEAWADAEARATINSKPPPPVTVTPGETLTGIATSHGDTLSSLIPLNQDLYNPVYHYNRIFPGQTVNLPKKTPPEVVAGVNNSQIKPIITALANLNLADQGVQFANRTHDPTSETLAHKEQTAAANAVKQDTYNMLLHNMSLTTPDQTATAQVQDLDALEPGNTDFANANNGALKEWQQLNFGPIIAAYNGGHFQPKTLADAIRTSFNNAANGAGSDPTARGNAIATRASLLEMFGPQTAAFKTAVNDAKGWAQPTDWSATTLPGSSHPGNDPFNVIISGNSNVTLNQFLTGLEYVPNPAGQPAGMVPPPLPCPTNPKYCIEPLPPRGWQTVPTSTSLLNPGTGPEYANVQPPGEGTRTVEQMNLRVGGKSTEVLGYNINHFRLYAQNPLPGNNQPAYFIADSLENPNIAQRYHDVATNGYNQGRDDLLTDIKTAAKMQGWTVQVEEYPTAPGTGSNGIRYDGNIYVVTLTHDKSKPPTS